MPPPVPVKLFQKSHRDCFLHATTSWLNYNFSPDKEAKLAIVRVNLPCGPPFLATLCPKAIHYDNVQKGVSHKKYLEIDNCFAKELRIFEQGMQVFVETMVEVEVCTRLVIAPKNPDDLAKLEHNLDKIDFELAEKIRIVSGQQSFSFPLWIDKIVVPIRVERTEPSATWVLIVPGTTKLEIIPGSDRLPLDQLHYHTSYDYDEMVRQYSISSPNPPKSRLSSANSSDSSVDSDGSSSQPLNLSLPSMAWTKLTSMFPTFMQQRTSPLPDEERRRMKGASSSEGFPFHHPPLDNPRRVGFDEFLRTVKPSSTVAGTDMKRELQVVPPSKSNSSGVRRTSAVTGSVKPSHERSQTWGSPSDFEVTSTSEKKKISNIPRSVNTPGLSARLRVQPHLTASENESDYSPSLWVGERDFDVFVNPASLPEVFLSLEDKTAAILVDLVPIESPSKPPQARAGTDDSGSRGGQESDLNDINRVPAMLEKQQVGGSEREHKGLPASLVVRLFFATKIRNRRARISGYGTQVEISKLESVLGDEEVVAEGIETIVEVPVAEGHILMSNVVRHQLSIAMCSGVMVNQVKDEWRIAYRQAPSLHIQPLYPPTQKISEERLREGILKQMSIIVEQMNVIDAIGTPLVNKQIFQLQLNQDILVYCSLRVTPYKRTTLTTPFLLVSPFDLKGKVNLYVTLSGGSSELSTRKPFSRRSSPTSPAEIKLPDMSELNLPVISESEKMVGGFEQLLADGELFLRTVFSKPGNSGCLLITGTTGPEGTGCGKTTLARLICKRAMKRPYYAHVNMVECTTFRGQSSARVKRRLRYYFSQAIQHHPSVLLLDDIEHAMPQVSDAQEQITEEGTASIKKTLVFLNLLQEVRSVSAQVVVIATVWYRNHLNQYLLQSRGFHVFDKTLELHPPTLAERKDILTALLNRMYTHEDDIISPGTVREVALRTEGYQPGDLETLVERAISHAELRTLNPMNSLQLIPDLTPESPRRKVRSRNPSASTSDMEPEGIDIPRRKGSSSSLFTQSTSPSMSITPPSLRRLMDQGGASFGREDSCQTVISASPSFRKTRSLSNMRLSLRDFTAALEGFVPVSLRGLPLHSAGSVDFSQIGGLRNAKETLTETLSWPSKYPHLFSECPIRQQCGVLLYGAPGTGKTMLAGAVAKEFGLNFISIKGPELLNKYIGASEEAVRNLFSRAQSAKPCILFFDEFESLAPKRGHDDTGVTDRVVNQFLTQLDGVEVLSGVYVLAASSRPDLIDPALLRPGRIDKKIECLIPDEEGRLDILRVLSQGLSMSESGLREIAGQTDNFTGADLKALLYSAQLEAAHEALDKKKREADTRDRRLSQHSLSELSPGAAAVMSDLEGLPEERVSSLSPMSSLVTFQSSPSGVSRCQDDLQKHLRFKVAKLKQKAYEKRKRHSVGTLKSLPLSKMGSPESKRQRHAGIGITMDHWRRALTQVRPSVSEKEKKKYQRIYDVFTGKTKPEPIKPKVTMS